MSEPNWSVEGDLRSDFEREPPELGSRIANTVVNRYGSTVPREIAVAADVEVRMDEWDGMDGLVMLGTYNGRTITLYSRQIEAYARERGVDREYLTEAIVAHELGHHFLATTGPSARPDGILNRIRVFCCGLANSKSAREAAANGFALELLDSHRPNSPILAQPQLLTDLTGTDR